MDIPILKKLPLYDIMLYFVIFVILWFSHVAVRSNSFPEDTGLFTFNVCDDWDVMKTLLSLASPKIHSICFEGFGLKANNLESYALDGQVWHSMSNVTLLGPQTAVARKIKEIFTRSNVTEVIFVSDKGNYVIWNIFNMLRYIAVFRQSNLLVNLYHTISTLPHFSDNYGIQLDIVTKTFSCRQYRQFRDYLWQFTTAVLNVAIDCPYPNISYVSMYDIHSMAVTINIIIIVSSSRSNHNSTSSGSSSSGGGIIIIFMVIMIINMVIMIIIVVGIMMIMMMTWNRILLSWLWPETDFPFLMMI